jgi:uncharacterized repeat protein (TIGR03837 family)
LNRSALLEFEIWCRVVDNFGDAGVCWRLARQLAGDWRFPVTLHVDRVPTLTAIEPRARAGARVDGVRIAAWRDDAPADAPGPVVVVSAFGCELPPRVRARVAVPQARALWVHLEYLSAEPWVEGCHGLASVKPDDGAVEHFFYPGYAGATGGLLRERGLLERRDAFRASGGPREWLAAHGVEHEPDEFLVSVFCYPGAPVARLRELLAESPGATRLLLAAGSDDGPPGFEGASTPRTGRPGDVAVSRLPWLAQDDYDRLLWSCDLNFVRGEDSWVRAQWAGLPFVWQPYRQEGGTHLVKLEAFLARLSGAGPRAASGPVAALMRAWSGDGDLGTAWRAYRDAFDAVRDLHREWTARLARRPDLATSLVEFCRDRL